MELTATDLIVVVGVALVALWFWPGRTADRAELLGCISALLRRRAPTTGSRE